MGRGPESSRAAGLAPLRPIPSHDSRHSRLQITLVARPRNHRQLTPRRPTSPGEFLFVRPGAGRQDCRQIAKQHGVQALVAVAARAQLDPLDHRADQVHRLGPVRAIQHPLQLPRPCAGTGPAGEGAAGPAGRPPQAPPHRPRGRPSRPAASPCAPSCAGSYSPSSIAGRIPAILRSTAASFLSRWLRARLAARCAPARPRPARRAMNSATRSGASSRSLRPSSTRASISWRVIVRALSQVPFWRRVAQP